MRISRRNYSILLGISLLGSSVALAQPAADGTTPVIIRFKQKPGQAEKNAVEGEGGKVDKTFTLVNAVTARVNAAAKDKLKKHSLVDVVEEDIRIQAHDAELDNTWGVKQIGAGTVHDAGNKGAGVNVCILDTGIDTTHPDLYLNYKGGWDYVNNDADPSDDNSHGTHVAGTIAALMNAANVRGAAPQANLYIYKILDAGGGGYASAIISALQECVRIGGKVSNSSFGSSADLGSTVKAAYDNAAASGVVNVASAGNSGAGTDTVGYPGHYSSVIAVAATDSSNAWASFSSTGPDVAVAAPGVSILSTYLGGQYAYKSGTSMASPHVAGVAALLVSCGVNGLTNVKQRLQSTALDLGTAGRDDYYGAGLVQADKAATNCTTPVAPTPVTDLAVSSVSAPTSTLTNTSTSVTVRVSNTGNQTASGFTLSLTDNGAFVGSQAVPTLAAGSAANLTFTWTTAITGPHTLNASLAQTDANTSNNSGSAVTTVNQATPSVVTVSATWSKKGNKRSVDLRWSGAKTTQVVVRQTGSASSTTTTTNDGQLSINVGVGTYTYTVCETNGGSCSNAVTVVTN